MLMHVYQTWIEGWALNCFGAEVAKDKDIRNYRFLEEALELVQACGCTKERALELVDYVYGRPVGEPSQEVGGVMVTLAALCAANGIGLERAAVAEGRRIHQPEIMDKIRAKQASKVGTSALPGSGERVPAQGEVCVLRDGTICRYWGRGQRSPVEELHIYHVKNDDSTADQRWLARPLKDIDWQATFIRRHLNIGTFTVTKVGERSEGSVPVKTIISDEIDRVEFYAEPLGQSYQDSIEIRTDRVRAVSRVGEMSIEMLDQPEDYRTNSTGDVAVSNTYRCRTDMENCPRSTKVYLIGKGGVGVLAQYDGDPFWVEWAALPARAE